MSEGKYISTDKYICQFCGRRLSRPCNLSAHSKTCVKNPNRISLHKRKESGWVCSICGTIFHTRADRNAHKSLSHRDDKNYFNQCHPRKNFRCSFCNKEWETTLEGCKIHERYCIENPNRIAPHSHAISEDLRKRISEKQKENYKGKSRFNIDRSQEPYSEKYFREWLEKENIEYKKNFHVDRFFLDFAFPDKKIYFEVNGEQHYGKMYNGKDYQERDKERTAILKSLGWICIATVRWSEFRSLQANERSMALNKLNCAIRDSSIIDFDFSYITDVKREKSIKRENAIKYGKINSAGRICNNKITNEEMNFRKESILNSGVDLSKFGWVEKVSKVTGLTRRQIYKTVNSTDLINYVYRR